MTAILFLAFGEMVREPILAVLDWIERYQWPMTAIIILALLIGQWIRIRRRRVG